MTKEGAEQAMLFDWALLLENVHPALKNMFHIVNEGKRTARTGAELKRQGLKRGVPDLFLAVPRNGKHGLFIEMKAEKNKPTKDQIIWLDKLTRAGYMCAVCWDFFAAKKVICDYLGIKDAWSGAPGKIVYWEEEA